MLSIERIKQLLGEQNMNDAEAETIRDDLRSLAEVIFEQWQHERSGLKENKNQNQNKL